MIGLEIKNSKNGLQNKIIFQIIGIVDKKIINRLYNASNAGVRIKIIVREIFCLIP
jgi:polyphosphate kinase